MLKAGLYIYILIFSFFALMGCSADINEPVVEKIVIQFDSQEGTFISDIEVNSNDLIELPVPEKEGFEFIGWMNNESKVPFDSLKATSNQTLTAQWDPKEFSLEFLIPESEIIIVFSAGSNIFGVVTSNNRVFTWGKNYYSQIGDGTNINRYYPVNISDSFNLDLDENIIDIKFGFASTFALTSSGRVFAWGLNGWSQL